MQTLISNRVREGTMLLDPDTVTAFGAAGMVLLAGSWLGRKHPVTAAAQVGWVLVGFYFFNQAWIYNDHDDIILTVLCAATLPLSVGMAWWEANADEHQRSAVTWARGTVAFAGGPYLLISYVPYFSVMAIWLVASQSAWFLGFTTGTDIQLGTTWVNDASGRVSWDEWDGNRWFATDFSGEYAFQTELIMADGGLIGINFVLACTALQSMVLFIGAIATLELSWKRRVRTLLLVIPIIHTLNLFRNAGLIWMHLTYTQWDLWGMSVFEFGHTYVARVVSLFAMFLIALIMFDLLPKMHQHILTLSSPVTKGRR